MIHHLNVHTDFADYLNAKKNIRRHQHLGDVCLYHPTNKYSREVAAAPLDRLLGTGDNHGDTLDFAQRYAIPDDDQVYVQDGYFCVQDWRICSVERTSPASPAVREWQTVTVALACRSMRARDLPTMLPNLAR